MKDDVRYLVESVDTAPKTGMHHNGPREPGVIITDLITGNVAICKSHRSQYKNRRTAMEMLEWANASG